MDSLLLQTHSDFFKTAIAEQHSIASEHRRKERRHVCILPRQNFFQNSERLLACINVERETHEVLVGHQPREKIDIIFAEPAQSLNPKFREPPSGQIKTKRARVAI